MRRKRSTRQSRVIWIDALPEYTAEQLYTGAFSGRRIRRGLYRTKDGTLDSADVNGAINISSMLAEALCNRVSGFWQALREYGFCQESSLSLKSQML